MRKQDKRLQPDEETLELLRVVKRVSRRTGMPIKELTVRIAKLIVAEQLRVEALDESRPESGSGDERSPA